MSLTEYIDNIQKNAIRAFVVIVAVASSCDPAFGYVHGGWGDGTRPGDLYALSNPLRPGAYVCTKITCIEVKVKVLPV